MHNHEMNQRHKKVLNTRRSTLVMIQKCIGIIIMLQITLWCDVLGSYIHDYNDDVIGLA